MASLIQGARDIFARNVATAGQFLKLPDYRISETLAGSAPQKLKTATYYDPAPRNASAPTVLGAANEQPALATKAGSPTASFGSLGGTNTNVVKTTSGPGPTAPQNNYSNAINQSYNMDVGNIEAEFQQELERLGGLENTTKGNYQQAIGQLQSYYPQFEQQLAKEKATDLATVDARENQVKQESASALSRTRNLLSELQRRQQAALSATGNYSSSAADAYGESFGKKAFEALSETQRTRDQNLAAVATQRQTVDNFYSRKAIEAKQAYDTQLSTLQQQLQGQLDQIANAKGAAASAKRQASADAWRNFSNNRLQLDQYMMEYQNSLDTWKKQQESSLSEAEKFTTGNDVLKAFTVQNPSVNATTGPSSDSAMQSARYFLSLPWEEQQKLLAQTQTQ